MKRKLIVTVGPHRTGWNLLHLHAFQLKFATFAHHYEQCRCGARRARNVGFEVGGRLEYPMFVDWLEGKE